jgi:hypothetical protein
MQNLRDRDRERKGRKMQREKVEKNVKRGRHKFKDVL